jgi:hypothetical protein
MTTIPPLSAKSWDTEVLWMRAQGVTLCSGEEPFGTVEGENRGVKNCGRQRRPLTARAKRGALNRCPGTGATNPANTAGALSADATVPADDRPRNTLASPHVSGLFVGQNRLCLDPERIGAERVSTFAILPVNETAARAQQFNGARFLGLAA